MAQRSLGCHGRELEAVKGDSPKKLAGASILSSVVLSIAVLTSPHLPRSVSQAGQVTALPSVALYGIASSLLPHFSQAKVTFNSPMEYPDKCEALLSPAGLVFRLRIYTAAKGKSGQSDIQIIR